MTDSSSGNDAQPSKPTGRPYPDMLALYTDGIRGVEQAEAARKEVALQIERYQAAMKPDLTYISEAIKSATSGMSLFEEAQRAIERTNATIRRLGLDQQWRSEFARMSEAIQKIDTGFAQSMMRDIQQAEKTFRSAVGPVSELQAKMAEMNRQFDLGASRIQDMLKVMPKVEWAAMTRPTAMTFPAMLPPARKETQRPAVPDARDLEIEALRTALEEQFRLVKFLRRKFPFDQEGNDTTRASD